ncbi:hypothetical protein HN51_000021 [Arachis hypogaea]|uniref:Uncharacterized protein n=1 Tax=Arachis hypogaea TaxID=3818 RepID=A0A445EXE7_ARAHY|nr:probable disease resistance protein At5g66900 [Arachis hypogaea]QHO47789.1 putative disease resistance protein [Arachis hypogaea]RYR80108.1 hypothetical protein Ahy_A01g004884 [Arachis hypogaea]
MAHTTQIAVLASLLQQASESILEMLQTARKSNQNRGFLRSVILTELTPLFNEIKQYNYDDEHLDRQREQITALITETDDDGASLCNCSCSSWSHLWENCFSWLVRHIKNNNNNNNDDDCDYFDEALREDLNETLEKLREIIEVLKCGCVSERRGVCGVPEKRGFTVGLEESMRKLKAEVMRERDGVSVIVLTGLAGSGKTTLATSLCWDQQVKGKFRENILFITCSKTFKIKIIVERLFEHSGYRVPEFQNEEDAINRMGVLLRHIGKSSPMLLVLDDVWPGSESLVEKFKIQTSSDYKILVTSRVAYPRFGTPCIVLEPLNHEDALTLFSHFAQLEDNYFSNFQNDEDILQKVVRGCKGSPLAITVIGRSIRNQPYEFWLKMVEKLSQGRFIFDSSEELLKCLENILEILEDKPIIKECFMDLGLFPEDQRIPVTVLLDIWTELYGMDDDGIEAMTIINTLNSMNLANVLVARKNACDVENYYYNNHFIVVHDLLRELAIYENNQEATEHRHRMSIGMNEQNGEFGLGEKQRGIIAEIFSKCLRWCINKQMPQQIHARTLSIAIDETCPSYWSNMQTADVEVLIFHLRAKFFSFPMFMQKMSKLKVLIVTNYGFYPSELNNFKLLDSLPSLKRIRLERISVPSFGQLKNLRKLSLYMCQTSHAFEFDNFKFSEACPNLVELNIDYSKDMVELPNGICEIPSLKKLCVTNCHKLCSLPKEIGNLKNLEILRLNSCTDLQGLPESIGMLSNLRLLDISNCISLPNLPEEISNLCGLRKLYMTSCANCELPSLISNLENLKVTCDEETATLWEAFITMIPNLRIEVPQVDVNLNWLHTVN